MKKIFNYIVAGIIIFFIALCFIVCSIKLDKLNLEQSGYSVIDYEAGNYKVYNNETKVIYYYNSHNRMFTPVIGSDGKPMIYNINE